MAFCEIRNVRIAGFSAGVPKEVRLTADEGSVSKDYDVNAYCQSTGVIERRYSNSLTIGDLCYHAANKILEDLQWEKSSIDALVLVTQTGDYIWPATSCILQNRLGLSKECYALDVNLGCSGWPYGLSVVSSLLSSGCLKRALLLAGEGCFWHNEKIDLLSATAGTVTAVEYREGDSFKFHFGTDGSGWDALYVPDGGARNKFTAKSLEYEEVDGSMVTRIQPRMLGMDVFGFGITVAPKSMKKLLEYGNMNLSQIDYLVLHQANKLMLDSIVKKMKVDKERVPMCIHKFGNTSSASIPLTIVTQLRNRFENDRQVLCCGFGVGLSWGTVLLKLYRDVVISELVEVEEND